jgi:hypothetical protein
LNSPPSLPRTILWRRLDGAGHDAARIRRDAGFWTLDGCAVFLDPAGECRLDYLVHCDPAWHTVSARVQGWIGPHAIETTIEVRDSGRWLLNGVECPAVAECVDVDLNFSPSTNLLPIRRLALIDGASADVRAAWLRFPTLTLELLEQRYRRIDSATYGYESGRGEFRRTLHVNDAGFVVEYPGLWVQETSSNGTSASVVENVNRA